MTKELGFNKRIRKIMSYINAGMKKDQLIVDEENGITENLDNILNLFEKNISEKSKKFKMPFKVKMGARNFHKKNKILVFTIKNKNIIIDMKQVINGMVKVDGNVHTVTPDSIMTWKSKIPTIILPSWQITPLKPTELYEQAEKEHNMVDAQTYAIRAFKKEGIAGMAKRFGGMSIIWIIIAVVAVGYFIFA